MSRTERWLLDVANLLVGGTGVVYGVMRYLLEPADEWAVVNHPWQPHVQHLHLVVAPLLVFAAGLVWRAHVTEGLAGSARRRPAGLALVVSLAPMVLSGVLIQVSVDPTWRQVWVWVHVVASTLWLAAYVIHRIRRRSADDEPKAPRLDLTTRRPG